MDAKRNPCSRSDESNKRKSDVQSVGQYQIATTGSRRQQRQNLAPTTLTFELGAAAALGGAAAAAPMALLGTLLASVASKMV